MSYTTINKSTDYFNTKLWAGNGSTQNITGVNHTPDFVWIKKRTDADGARIFDTIRGATKGIFTNSGSAETTVTSELSAFGSDGYTLGASDAVNGNSKNYVGWNWKAGTTGSGTTTGSGYGKAYSYSVSTTSGFSIVKYKGNGTAGHTIPHHLCAVPKFIIVKRLDGTSGWHTYHASLGNTQRMSLNETDATSSDSTAWNDTTPTSTVFTVGNSGTTNVNDADTIAYCFAEKTGYSRLGSYTGNGSSNGTFIYTGFKPAFLLYKNTTQTDSWFLHDNRRQGFNPENELLFADLNNAESTVNRINLFSNGFKAIDSDKGVNAAGNTYIYMAFGQSLVGSNNVPCTAR